MSDIHFELKNIELYSWLGAVASLGELQKSRLQISPQCVILEAINIANTIYFNAELSRDIFVQYDEQITENIQLNLSSENISNIFTFIRGTPHTNNVKLSLNTETKKLHIDTNNISYNTTLPSMSVSNYPELKLEPECTVIVPLKDILRIAKVAHTFFNSEFLDFYTNKEAMVIETKHSYSDEKAVLRLERADTGYFDIDNEKHETIRGRYTGDYVFDILRGCALAGAENVTIQYSYDNLIKFSAELEDGLFKFYYVLAPCAFDD